FPSIALLFLCILRRHPRSTLFPYTTLFRSTMPGWYWLLLRSQRDAGAPVAGLVLARCVPGRAVLDVVDVIWDQARLSAASVMHADRKSTRLNSSHSQISYAVFCLKKKKKTK